MKKQKKNLNAIYVGKTLQICQTWKNTSLWYMRMSRILVVSCVKWRFRTKQLCKDIRDGSNLYLIWSAWFDLKIYLVPSFAWFGLIWRFKYLGLIWLEQFENCKCLTWLGLVFKYLKKAWAWSFDFLKGLIWLEKYKPESNLQPRIIITEKLWIFYFCILLDVILRSICNFNISFFN